MDYFSERRKYQRCSSTICKVSVSVDRCRWQEAELRDISAGGLKFAAKRLFNQNTPLYFDLLLYNALSEFNIKLEGAIIRQESDKDGNLYAVKFVNIDKYKSVQLDEIIRSKITVNNTTHQVPEDGTYTFLFMPRIRSRKIRLYR